MYDEEPSTWHNSYCMLHFNIKKMSYIFFFKVTITLKALTYKLVPPLKSIQ